MTELKFVEVEPAPLERFRPLLGERFEQIEEAAVEARRTFGGKRIWHVNSTAQGGGVAEMLRALLPYVRGAGVDTRWVVLPEGNGFFAVTKRIHNQLHGHAGDGALDDRARAVYEGALRRGAGELSRLLEPGDIVYLHDPQTAGLVPAMREAGATVVWRCHVGVDRPNELAREAWEFLRRYVEDADAYVFSRREYLWEGLDEAKAWFMPPVIDPFSPKNENLDDARRKEILAQVEAKATVLGDGPLPEEATVVAQVSRWDRLKDPRGLLDVFEHHLDQPSLHLVLVGLDSAGVSDDPEGAAVYDEVAEHWRRMGAECRRRSRLISLPMTDLRENAAMVNALQRRAEVIVQKSLAEGFGLTVAEAMWKARPVVASRVGGIQDQVRDGETGILVDDPRDLPGFARAIESILGDRDRCSEMGRAGRERVRGSYLAVDRLREYVGLVAALLDRSS
jgi:trehalose synthase